MLSTSMHESCATLNLGINCFSSAGAYLLNFAFNFQSSVLSGATIDDDPEAECRRCCAFNFPVSASVCNWVGGGGGGGGGGRVVGEKEGKGGVVTSSVTSQTSHLGVREVSTDSGVCQNGASDRFSFTS